ncbi:MAG: hypothetical protein U1F68_11995 [Gammaproteobacteria bacterium]
MKLIVFLAFPIWLTTLAPWTASAQTSGAYKCVDAQGQVKYTAVPEEGLECTSLRATPKPSADPQAALQKLREQVKATETPPAQANQQAAATPEEQKAKNCEVARKNLEMLQGKSEVVQTDAQGKKILVSAEQRAALTAQASKDISYFCQ